MFIVRCIQRVGLITGVETTLPQYLKHPGWGGGEGGRCLFEGSMFEGEDLSFRNQPGKLKIDGSGDLAENPSDIL